MDLKSMTPQSQKMIKRAKIKNLEAGGSSYFHALT